MTRCKVCNSINRELYEQLIRDGATLEELVVKAKELGEDISIASFSRHKNKHMVNEVDMNKIIRDREFKKYVKNLDIKKEIYDILIGLKNEFDKLISNDNSNPKAIADISRELRQTIDKVSNLLGSELVSSDDMLLCFIRSIKYIPYEYQVKIVSKLRECNIGELE